ncbi:MAG: hypothetical protein ACFFEN_04110 [Candidatus Thorarchaeota archaeon]
MNDVEKDKDEHGFRLKKKKQKEKRMTQGQLIQQTLGLKPSDIEEVEKKLFIARFLDFFTEDTLEFIFKERNLEQNISRMVSYLDQIDVAREEEKLLKQSFESKDIVGIIKNVKDKSEALAISKGQKNNVNKRLRKLTLLITLPIFALLIVFTAIPILASLYYVFFPILCVACLAPQLIRGSVVKKWFQFKEQNKNELYEQNRDDLMILKGFTSDILNNIRARLLELKVPLQLIKFTLFSRDYENLELINQRNIRGFTQYFYTFQYPLGMDPLPIPESLQRYQQPISTDKKIEKPEKNFIVLTEIEGKNGVITYFVPTLKDVLADKINTLLNTCTFTKVSNDFKTIIPDYPEKLAIPCVCGEIAKFENIQICNWHDEFKFYLFEGETCECGEAIYVLSLMDKSTKVPEEFEDIFLS